MLSGRVVSDGSMLERRASRTPSLVQRHSMTSVEDATLWVARDGRWLFIGMRFVGEG